MKYLLCILLFVFAVSAQEPPKSPDDIPKQKQGCDHPTEDDFYASLEHTPPVALTMIDGRSLTVVRTTPKFINHLTLTMDGLTRVPKTVYQIDYKKKRFFVLYCRLHKHAYIVEELK